MKKISFLSLLFLFFTSLCFAVEVDRTIPYRVYIGEDKTCDWIDIKSTGYLDKEENYIVDFQDLSPIEWIDYCPNAGFYLIQKKDSVWKLYLKNIPEEAILKRCDYFELAPLNRMLVYCKRIYKR